MILLAVSFLSDRFLQSYIALLLFGCHFLGKSAVFGCLVKSFDLHKFVNHCPETTNANKVIVAFIVHALAFGKEYSRRIKNGGHNHSRN